MNHSHGLTIVGVGPGDPSLITLAAIREIESADVIAFPISNEGGESMAAHIACKWIAPEMKKLPLIFPMVNEDEIKQTAWRDAGQVLIKEVDDGKKVAFLCQGDVSLFATGSYLLLEMLSSYPECPVRLIPGVTAVSAAAAAAKWPLALEKDQLLIVPTPDNVRDLETLLQESSFSNRALALIKLGHRWPLVRSVLVKEDLLRSSLFVQRVGFPDQKIIDASELDESAKPYFSLLLIRKNTRKYFPLS